jgi:hypothetical protein
MAMVDIYVMCGCLFHRIPTISTTIAHLKEVPGPYLRKTG